MTQSARRGHGLARELERPHIYLQRDYYRVTPWNHVISTLGNWRHAHDFVLRLNNHRHFGTKT